MLNVAILKLARESRFITQNELAEILKIEQGTISKIEKEILVADEALIEKLAFALDYPVSFLCQDKKVLTIEGHYRRKISSTVKRMKQLVAKMTIAEWHLLSLLDEVELPDNNLPKWKLEEDGSPALCAKHLREFWKIPKGRLTNLTKLVEDNGVVVISLDLEDMDGFSTLVEGSIPVIFINKNLSPDRYRLTLAHELGHLIMHFGNKISPERDLEKEAFAFAIELLVPENNIRPYLSRVTIEKLADLKSYWYVSMQALLRYANTLQMVTGNQYRYLWMQMGALGYRRNEPVKIPPEKPGILEEIFHSYLHELSYSKEELARVLQMTLPQMEQTYFGAPVKLKIIRKAE
jgi:Zn-dependent peptidase ImmA (M78 family)/DNA-binding XRE family transcriptional regulator